MAAQSKPEKEWVAVPLSELQPGWTVDRDIWWHGALLLGAGVQITAGMVDALRHRGVEHLEVQCDSTLASYSARPLGVDALTELLAQTNDVYSKHRLKMAIPAELLEQATDQVETFFTEIELGQSFDPEVARQTVRSMVKAFTASANLAVKLLDLDRFDRYTYRHSINVGLLYLMLASDLVKSDQELEDCVFGAVLHDLGKAKVGSALVNKPGPLDPDEKILMHKHPIWSHEMLGEAGAVPSVASIARHHHERMNGQGYPDGQQGDEISIHAKLSAICDVYDAVTSKRSYKKKMEFSTAVSILISGSGSEYDPDLVHHFLRKVGRYPVGSFVRLSNGDVALVLRVNEKAINRPVVSTVLTAEGQRVDLPHELDLSAIPEIFISGAVASREQLEA